VGMMLGAEKRENKYYCQLWMKITSDQLTAIDVEAELKEIWLPHWDNHPDDRFVPYTMNYNHSVYLLYMRD
jgi:hypothetical protein